MSDYRRCPHCRSLNERGRQICNICAGDMDTKPDKKGWSWFWMLMLPAILLLIFAIVHAHNENRVIKFYNDEETLKYLKEENP